GPGGAPPPRNPQTPAPRRSPGRGGEEALFLATHGIEVEVVPGVSSILATGLPLTHRGLSSGFAVVSGVLEDGGYPDLRAFAQVPTLVVLMG
ncbi:SAM-dependent methyltransferase, partial [Acinetobacter baumannii]